jgi:RND family efflux transporter MFP subunit
MNIRHYTTLTVCSVVGALLIGCSKETPPKRTSLSEAEIRVVKVELESYSRTEPVMGTLVSRLQASLEAKVTGRIVNLPVVEGQHVEKGELVAELDVQEIRAKQDQAKALLDQTERDFKRSELLLKQQSTTQAEFDATQSRYRAAQAGLAEAEAVLAYARVLAPFRGIISRKMVDTGDLAAPGKALVQIEDASTIRIEADVPENLMSGIAPGAKLRAHIPAAGKWIEASVAEIAPVVRSDSRTLLVKFDISKHENLRSGMFCLVEVPAGASPMLRIPASAVVQRGQMEIVFVVTNKTAQLRLVKQGKKFDDHVEILSGIDPGEVVVVEGAAGLMDGQPVKQK